MMKTYYLLFSASILALTIGACKDDFNEQEFMDRARKATEIAYDSIDEETVRNYIAVANEAGDLLALTLMARENGAGVPGVTVTLTTSTPNSVSSGRAQAFQSGVTDASGIVVFDRVTIGSGIISFKKTGYVSSTATVDFGKPVDPIIVPITHPNGSTINKFVSPTKRFEEAIIPMYSATPGASTATIVGKVVIENDVTNKTQEIPAGVVIRANLAGLILVNNAPFISNFALEDNATLGVATVASNGSYSMTVPATAAGLNVGLIIPNIEGTSRMAINGYDDGTGNAEALANGPEYKDIPTSWGPEAGQGFGNTIPQVAGAKLTFPTAPIAGTGLKFDFTPVPRPMTSATITNSEITKLGDTFYRIVSRGNYSSGPTPVVSVSGGGGQGAKATAFMRTYVSAVNVTNPGNGYQPGTSCYLNLVRVLQDNSEMVENAILITVTPAGTIPSTIDLSAFNVAGFKASNQKSLVSDVKSLKLTITKENINNPGGGAEVAGTFKTELASLLISSGGNGYTSAPTFVFTGGTLVDGSANHASVQVVDFPVHWTITPNNANATDYPILPGFLITYPPTPLATMPLETDVEAWSTSGTLESTSSLLSRLTISSGDVVKREENRILRTISKSGGPPIIVVTPQVPSNATRKLTANDIGSDGGVQSVPNGNNGNGYSSALTVSITPAIAGAPGSGAIATLSNIYNFETMEYIWNGGITIDNPGSGYLKNLNQKTAEPPVFPSALLVQAGKTYTMNINFGTGNRKVNIN